MSHEDGLACVGAPAIAKFVGATVRQIYHWHERGSLPAFKEGKLIIADKAALRAWLSDRTAAARKPAVAA